MKRNILIPILETLGCVVIAVSVWTILLNSFGLSGPLDDNYPEFVQISLITITVFLFIGESWKSNKEENKHV